jgi:F-type H+-transporting ATP synthase subunit e
LIRQAKEQWARDHPAEKPKSSGGTSWKHSRTRESHAIEADKDIANVDPKDPNANYLALIGITDK